MDELTQLAIKYKTDKWGKHHYTPVYYELFKDRRKDVKKVLEIGPAEGAGLFMFRDFFPNATIYGAEISRKRVEKLKNLERIKVSKCDQSSSDDILNFIDLHGDNFDLIIDDGSHKIEDQMFSYNELIETVIKNSGVYIIEDVRNTSIIDKIRFVSPPSYSPELIRVGQRYDDQLVIVTPCL